VDFVVFDWWVFPFPFLVFSVCGFLTCDETTGFTCVYTLFAFITFLTFCQPINGQWDRSVNPKCYNKELYRDFGLFNAGEFSIPAMNEIQGLLLMIQTACNITTDILFATLPIPLIWSLQLQRRMRIYLIAILSGGYL